MPRVLIAGCGYVGAATADLFQREGWKVEGWTSSPESAEQLQRSAGYCVRSVDITDPALLAQHTTAYDAIIQSVSSRGGGADQYRRIYLHGAQALGAAFPDALHVFTSSTSVYGQSNGEWVTEQSLAEPTRETGRVLLETEKFVLGRGGIVARLAGIYGPGRSALLQKFLDGKAVLDPVSDRFLNQAHRDDIAAALFLLVKRGIDRTHRQTNAAPAIYNVSDSHPLSQRQCYEWLATQLERPLPQAVGIVTERKRGNSNKRVSSAKLQALGWAPRYPTFQSAMLESILPAHGL